MIGGDIDMTFYGGGELDSLISGLRDLKSGALFEIISIIALTIAFAPLFAITSLLRPMALSGPMGPKIMPLAGLMITQVLLIFGAALIAIILTIFSFYKLYKAASYLKEYDRSRLGIGKTGILLMIMAIILIIIAGVSAIGFFAVTSFSTSTFVPTGPFPFIGPAHMRGLIGAAASLLLLMMIVGILALVGSIFFGIMIMRLGEIKNVEPGFKTAGIIYIISVILSLIPYIAIAGFILSIISLIMIYSCAGRSLGSLETS